MKVGIFFGQRHGHSVQCIDANGHSVTSAKTGHFEFLFYFKELIGCAFCNRANRDVASERHFTVSKTHFTVCVKHTLNTHFTLCVTHTFYCVDSVTTIYTLHS